MTSTQNNKTHTSKAEWGSDVIVDVLRDLDIEYIAVNPGATYRGLHDSLINYGNNTAPEMILCNHEEITVAIAHGYGKAAGKPMAAAVHNIVGLLHASMAMFNASMDRASVMLLGGTGPMAVDKRRPWIDWIHTALVQGEAVRPFIKWDDQPASIPSFVDSLIRAYHITNTRPKGPVYVCFDADLQEQKLDEPFQMPEVSSFSPPTRVQADPVALSQAAGLLAGAKNPVIVANFLGTVPGAVEALVRLAESLAIPVIDGGDLVNFPTHHPLNITSAAGRVLQDADVVLALDVYDLQQTLNVTNYATRGVTSRISGTATVIDISLRQFIIKSWADDYGRLYPANLAVTADTALAIPALADLCADKVSGNSAAIETRRSAVKAIHDEMNEEAQREAAAGSNISPIAVPFLAQQVFEVVKDQDWVIANGDLRGWAQRLWDIDKPYQFMDSRGGGGLGQGLGHSIGVALAHKGKGRLVIDLQADGDFLFTPSALWTAAHHKIPLLIVMYNNRSYFNDEDHQENVARTRGRSVENRVVGIRMDSPPVDFASLARSLGVYGEGPIEHPDDLKPALERAMKVVLNEGRCALVDVITQNR